MTLVDVLVDDRLPGRLAGRIWDEKRWNLLPWLRPAWARLREPTEPQGAPQVWLWSVPASRGDSGGDAVAGDADWWIGRAPWNDGQGMGMSLARNLQAGNNAKRWLGLLKLYEATEVRHGCQTEWLYVCMYIYKYVYRKFLVHVYTYIHIYIYAQQYMFNIFFHTYVILYIYKQNIKYIYIYNLSLSLSLYTYIYIYMYRFFICIYTHICTWYLIFDIYAYKRCAHPGLCSVTPHFLNLRSLRPLPVQSQTLNLIPQSDWLSRNIGWPPSLGSYWIDSFGSPCC